MFAINQNFDYICEHTFNELMLYERTRKFRG